jgi:hypothetical protein
MKPEIVVDTLRCRRLRLSIDLLLRRRLRVNRFKPYKLLASAALLCLLVAAESMAVVHSLDLDAHAAGESCKICISVAGFGSAAPARSPTLLPPPSSGSEAFLEVRALVVARTESPVARGPPSFS